MSELALALLGITGSLPYTAPLNIGPASKLPASIANCAEIPLGLFSPCGRGLDDEEADWARTDEAIGNAIPDDDAAAVELVPNIGANMEIEF